MLLESILERLLSHLHLCSKCIFQTVSGIVIRSPVYEHGVAWLTNNVVP